MLLMVLKRAERKAHKLKYTQKKPDCVINNVRAPEAHLPLWLDLPVPALFLLSVRVRASRKVKKKKSNLIRSSCFPLYRKSIQAI